MCGSMPAGRSPTHTKLGLARIFHSEKNVLNLVYLNLVSAGLVKVYTTYTLSTLCDTRIRY